MINGMKLTLDLPPAVIRKAKSRAAAQGRKVNDLAEDLFRSAFGPRPKRPRLRRKAEIVRDELTGLPVIQCTRAPSRDWTPEEIHQILLDEEVARAIEAARR